MSKKVRMQILATRAQLLWEISKTNWKCL